MEEKNSERLEKELNLQRQKLDIQRQQQELIERTADFNRLEQQKKLELNEQTIYLNRLEQQRKRDYESVNTLRLEREYEFKIQMERSRLLQFQENQQKSWTFKYDDAVKEADHKRAKELLELNFKLASSKSITL